MLRLALDLEFDVMGLWFALWALLKRRGAGFSRPAG